MTIPTENGLHVVDAEHGGIREIFVTGIPSGGVDLAAMGHGIRRILDESEAEVLEARVFGSVDAYAESTEILRQLLGGIEWPFVFVQGESCEERATAGVQLHAVSGAAVETIRRAGRPVGRVFEDEFARYCVLGGLQSPDPSRTPERQTRDTLEEMLAGLAAAGMDTHSIARTWFYIDDILGWYGDFNRVRSEIYSAEGFFDRYLPASTGIGGSNPDHAAVVACVLGIQAKGEAVRVREIPSPLQCPAMSYGSSFSRAAEVVTPDCRCVLVSGTASIDSEGRTAHQGDVDAQIAYTLEVVGAILESKDMDFGDVTRGNAYFRNPADAVHLKRHAERHGLLAPQVVVSQNDVCRDDLLFELEVEAVKAKEA